MKYQELGLEAKRKRLNRIMASCDIIGICLGILGMAEIIYLAYGRNPKTEENYQAKYNHFLSLADKNSDGVISISEQIEAWKRMGLISQKIFVESEGTSNFRKPELSDLEKGIASYENELERIKN